VLPHRPIPTEITQHADIIDTEVNELEHRKRKKKKKKRKKWQKNGKKKELAVLSFKSLRLFLIMV
jgi:hypothetical protein